MGSGDVWGMLAEALPGLWRGEAIHPEWTPETGDEEGWDPRVAWWAVKTSGGLVLIDPLVEEWETLDALVEAQRGCAGVVRTCHWHERSIGAAGARYGVGVWAKQAPPGISAGPLHHAVADGEQIFDGWLVRDVRRHDEVALWLPGQRALVVGDAMIRLPGGELRVCPETWTQPPGGPAELRAVLGRLSELEPEHVLVSHGPMVAGDGASALTAALA